MAGVHPRLSASHKYCPLVRFCDGISTHIDGIFTHWPINRLKILGSLLPAAYTWTFSPFLFACRCVWGIKKAGRCYHVTMTLASPGHITAEEFYLPVPVIMAQNSDIGAMMYVSCVQSACCCRFTRHPSPLWKETLCGCHCLMSPKSILPASFCSSLYLYMSVSDTPVRDAALLYVDVTRG